MIPLSSEIGYYCLGDSKVRSTGMAIPYARIGAVHPALYFGAGVCDGSQIDGSCDTRPFPRRVEES